MENQRPTYSTLSAYAQERGIPLKALRRAIRDGCLPSYRWGERTIYLRRDEAEAWEATQRVEIRPREHRDAGAALAEVL